MFLEWHFGLNLYSEGFWALSRHIPLICCEMHQLWFNLWIGRLWKACHFKQKSSAQMHYTWRETLMKRQTGSSLSSEPIHNGSYNYSTWLQFQGVRVIGLAAFGPWDLHGNTICQSCQIHTALSTCPEVWRTEFEHLCKAFTSATALRTTCHLLCSQTSSATRVPERRDCLKVALLHEDLLFSPFHFFLFYSLNSYVYRCLCQQSSQADSAWNWNVQ